jgi:hypothetical protein
MRIEKHSSLSLPFRIHSRYKSDECQEYGENHLGVRISGMPLQLLDFNWHEINHTGEKRYSCKQ